MKLPLMLLREWSWADPANWIIQPKIDGIRCQWDGRRLWTRGGHPIDCPTWITDGLPADQVLDGELAVDTLPGMLSIYARGRRADWSQVRYHLFDIPVIGPVIEDRLEILDHLDLPDHAEVVPRWICKGAADLEDRLHEIAIVGGEGIVMRQQHSTYQDGRSGSARKLRL